MLCARRRITVRSGCANHQTARWFLLIRDALEMIWIINHLLMIFLLNSPVSAIFPILQAARSTADSECPLAALCLAIMPVVCLSLFCAQRSAHCALATLLAGNKIKNRKRLLLTQSECCTFCQPPN